jgi:hypothetical protein
MLIYVSVYEYLKKINQGYLEDREGLVQLIPLL